MENEYDEDDLGEEYETLEEELTFANLISTLTNKEKLQRALRDEGTMGPHVHLTLLLFLVTIVSIITILVESIT